MTMPADPAPPRSALVAICAAALILPMSFSGGAVATPAIGRAFGGDPAGLAWITNAFMLTFGCLLLTAGALADRWGPKRVFLSGLAIFTVASTLLVVASTLVALDLLRAGQGIGAAGALAGGTAALAQEVTGSTRARAFSLLGTAFGVGLAFGPLAAGLLMQAAGWRAVFVAPAAIAVLAALSSARSLRETQDRVEAPMDWWGAATFTLALACLTTCILQAPGWGWTSLPTVGLAVAAATGFALFARFERGHSAPLLELDLLRDPRFLGVQLLPVATCYCFVVLLVLLPLRFIGIEGRSETAAGMAMLALSAPMLVAPTVAVRLARKHSAGTISAAGLMAAAAGLLWLAGCGPGSGSTPIPAMLLIGLGAGLPWGLMDGLSVAVVPADRAGMATGIFSTTRVAGEGIALASVNAALAALVHSRLNAAEADSGPRHALMAGRLAAGDLTGAVRLDAKPELLRLCYADGSSILLLVLAGVACVCAILTYLALRQVEVHSREVD